MIDVICSECRYGIKAKDALAGKLVHCPECKARVRIPQLESGFEVVEDEPVRQHRSAASDRPRQTVSVKSTLLPAPPEIEDDEDRPRRKVRRRRKRREGDNVQLYIWCGVFAVLFFFAMIGFVSAGMAAFTSILAMVMSWVGGIWILVICFQEDAICGVLCLLLPLYSLYYAITRWDECKRPFAISAGGFVIMILSAIATATHEQAGVPKNANGPFGRVTIQCMYSHIA